MYFIVFFAGVVVGFFAVVAIGAVMGSPSEAD